MTSCTKQHRWVVASQSYYEQWTRGAYETRGSGREPRMHTWWTARCPARAPFIAASARETKSNTKSSQSKAIQKQANSQHVATGRERHSSSTKKTGSSSSSRIGSSTHQAAGLTRELTRWRGGPGAAQQDSKGAAESRRRQVQSGEETSRQAGG